MSEPKKELYITIMSGELKAGTCEHCVVGEKGRPERAWDAPGDKDLDFDRDGLIMTLASLGIQITVRDEFICP